MTRSRTGARRQSFEQLSLGLGAVLHTHCPLVGVLVTHDDRRLIAVQPIAEGDVLFRLEGRETATPTRFSVQIGRGVHLDQECARNVDDVVHRYYWRYMNHDCAPSTVIRDREVIALRALSPGDAVTFDYNTTEDELAEPFQCHCGSRRCVGVVRGARHLSPAQRARVTPWLSAHLR